jgi:hypothetical protein
MTLRSGINVSYNRDFVIDENVLRGVKVALEQAARGLPCPTEIVYSAHLKDDIYYETNRIEEIVADPNAPPKQIDYLLVELRRADQLVRVEGNPQAGWQVSEWIVLLSFDLLSLDWWVPYRDRISLRIDSEDKVWVSNLADEIDRLVKEIPRPKKVANWLFLGYALPAFLNGIGLFLHPLSLQPLAIADRAFTAMYALFSFGMLAAGYFSLENVRPGVLKRFFGPESVFLWGEREKHHRAHESVFVRLSWVIFLVMVFMIVNGFWYLFG